MIRLLTPAFNRMAAALLLVILAVAPVYAVEIKEVISPKGIRAWLVQDDFVPLIALQFSFQGGSAQDPKGQGRPCQSDDRPFR